MNGSINSRPRAGLVRLVACAAAVLATAAPAWADVAPYSDLPVSTTCGSVGGFALSAMLAVGGCWAVWSQRRWRG